MKRKDFLKNSLLGLAATSTIPALAKNETKESSTYDKLMEQVGFNHLPNEEVKTAQTVLHKASTRGHSNHGWLDSHHSFSFANYYNPDRMHFGVLRVLNDDIVAGGRGFRLHPHDNMEIISIPLEGALQHKDTLGNTHVIRKGDIQAMSAGTGIYHSEYNEDPSKEVRFLQIWLFPHSRSVQPRYDQLKVEVGQNELTQVLSPSQTDAGVWIHQNAWFHMGDLTAGRSLEYKVKRSGNGVYAFVIDGAVNVAGQDLSRRDGFGIWNVDGFSIKATSNAKLLLMDVPMTI